MVLTLFTAHGFTSYAWAQTNSGPAPAVVTHGDFDWAITLGASAVVCILGLLLVRCRGRARVMEVERSGQQNFFRQLMQSQEDERKRIARELHDSLGQDLLLIKTSAELALRGSKADSPSHSRLQQIQALAANAVQGVRSITNDLRPPELDRLGLAAAVEAMADKVSENSDIQLDCEVEKLDDQLTRSEEINLYRIIQESLTNAVKHARANHIKIEAQRYNGSLSVLITDNGRGFEPRTASQAPRPAGMGLAGLAERARILGGSLKIDSATGAGTRVSVKIPIRHDEHKR